MRPLRLERAPDGKPVILATRVAERQYPEDIVRLREQLRSMVAAEQEARLAYDQPRWEGIDAKNRPEAPRIFDRYGWVAKSLAGSDAAHNYWLLVQHQTPEIQKRLLPALEKAELFLLPVAEYLGTEYLVKFCAGK